MTLDIITGGGDLAFPTPPAWPTTGRLLRRAGWIVCRSMLVSDHTLMSALRDWIWRGRTETAMRQRATAARVALLHGERGTDCPAGCLRGIDRAAVVEYAAANLPLSFVSGPPRPVELARCERCAGLGQVAGLPRGSVR